jgi:hypothetical protein
MGWDGMDEKGHFNHIKLTKLPSVHPKQNHVTRWMKKGLITFNSKATHPYAHRMSILQDG